MDSANKKRLAASAVLIVASIALFLGLTFAWFTDSVTNKGNRIQAGTLDVQLLKNGVDISESADPVFSHNAWEPGYSTGASLSVKNAGNLALKYELGFEPGDMSGSKGIENVIDVYVGDALAGTLVEYLNGKTLDAGVLKAGETSAGKAVKLKMRETAGNDYQGVVATFDVVLVATQAPVEEDGFDNTDYDKDAAFPTIVGTADGLKAAAAKGGTVELSADVALAESTTFDADTTLDLNGKSLKVGDGSQSIKAAAGTTLVIEGDGKIDGVVYADNKFGNNGATVVINAGENFSINSSSSMGWAVYGSKTSKIVVRGGTYTASLEGGGVIHCLGSSLAVSDAVVNVGAKTMNDSVGIHSNASQNTLENVTVNGQYSSAVNFNDANSSSAIRGGSFITNQTADASPASTIRYQGKLHISDASITHIGTGIMYTAPGASEVVGLTVENCTFNSLGSGPETDYKHN